MNPLKKLAGQTALYGLSSILGRILGYLLVPLYTRVLDPAGYGSVIELYSYIALLLVLLTYGMETAFFRFAESTAEPKKVFATGFLSLTFTSILFIILVLALQTPLAQLIEYELKPQYITYLAWILVFDALTTLPFAKLRQQNRPLKFVSIKLLGIFSNIGLNLFFILFIPYLLSHFPDSSFSLWCSSWYMADQKVDYIFISNLISSGLMLLFLIPAPSAFKGMFSVELLKKMLRYALPLLVFGLAGVVNEVIDRVLLKYLLPDGIAMEQLGIYGAVYKISILMTIFIQAYRYAAEPFFFAQEKHKEARQTYAQMMNYFVMVTALIFLGTMLYMDLIIHFVGKDFRSGAPVIPILLMANLFLGLYYNLSIWYKLTNQTKFGAYISIFGAVLTLVLNFIFIPLWGYYASAWITFICYGSMVLISYFLGQKHYPIPYNLKVIAQYLGTALGLYIISLLLEFPHLYLKLAFNTTLLLAYLSLLYFRDIKPLLTQKSKPATQH